MERGESRGLAAQELMNADERRYLVFTLDGGPYAIPLLQVKEVIANTETTPIPHAPAHFKGIMNLRGLVISVIDLRTKFKMPKSDVRRENAIIILDLPDLCLGVIVDSVDYVHALADKDLSPPPDAETAVAGDYLLGVARQDKRLILILDIARTLSVQDLTTLNQQTKKTA